MTSNLAHNDKSDAHAQPPDQFIGMKRDAGGMDIWYFLKRYPNHFPCWSWSSNTWATWCKELTLWKRSWCWERWKAWEANDRGWDGWMASLTRWTWVWVNSRSWWWTGRPGVLQSMGSQRVGTIEQLNWTDACSYWMSVLFVFSYFHQFINFKWMQSYAPRVLTFPFIPFCSHVYSMW